MPRANHAAPESDRTMQVVDHIRSLIEKGKLKLGDKIPAERDLASLLKISRASVRTGVGYLAATGVIKVRHGVGSFVANGPAEFGKAAIGLLSVLHGYQSWQMFEARLILECNLAELAALRGRHEDHSAIAEEVAEMFATLDNPTGYLIHDVLFHRAIGLASGNPILAALMETITSTLYDKRRKTVERAVDLRESAEMHRKIYRAIRAGKAVEARKLMEQHLRKAEAAQDLERSTKPHPPRSTQKQRKTALSEADG